MSHVIAKGLGFGGVGVVVTHDLTTKIAVGIVIGSMVGSDIILDKIIRFFDGLFSWAYPASLLERFSSYDVTLIMIFLIAMILIVAPAGAVKGGKM